MRASELGLKILGRLINWEGGEVERYVQGNHAVESSRQWELNKLFLTEAAVKFSYFATQNNTIGPGKSLPPALKLTCFKRIPHVAINLGSQYSTQTSHEGLLDDEY